MMNKIFRIVAVAFLLIAPTIVSAQSAPAETEMIVVSKAYDLLNALNAATGNHDIVVGQGANERVVQVPYKLSGDTVWLMTDNITNLRKFWNTVQETMKSLTAQAEAKNGGPLKPLKEAVLDGTRVVAAEVASPEQIALTAELQKLLDSQKPIPKLFRVKRAEWKVGENRYPAAILSSLDIITEP